MTEARKLAIAFALGASVLMGLWLLISPLYSHQAPDTQVATVVPPKPTLSGFELTDTNGHAFNAKSMRGHWTLLFFGYADCPDVCPATLSLVKETWHRFAPTEHPANFVFASINPTPDTPKKLKKFLDKFNEKFIGISGTAAEMNKLVAQLPIFSDQNSTIDEAGQLRINHSASLLLIDPQVKLKALFTPPFNSEAIASDLAILTR